MKNKMVYKGNNVVGALMNVPIFVGTFSVMMDFAILENMDAYRDEGMGDVIFGKPFLREVDIKVKRFEGMITLYKGDDEVTYQMVRSHSRYQDKNAPVIPIFYAIPREGNIDEYCRRFAKCHDDLLIYEGRLPEGGLPEGLKIDEDSRPETTSRILKRRLDSTWDTVLTLETPSGSAVKIYDPRNPSLATASGKL
ncbi:hypothetical protein Tco_0179631 [Tanacetum coccineum]